jgi:hypothetical protein
MLSLPKTPKSDLIEEDVDNEQKKNRLPLLFQKKPKYEHSQLKKSVTPEHIDSTTYPPASIEEIPDEEMTVPEEILPRMR